MASVTWPPLVTAAPISSSVKVARARPGTAAARRPMRVARTGGTGTAVVDIGRSRRGGWRGRAPQHPPQPVAPTLARTAPATPPRSPARARPCKLQLRFSELRDLLIEVEKATITISEELPRAFLERNKSASPS